MLQIQRSLAGLQATGTEFHRPHLLSWLAEGHAKAGHMEEGLTRLAEALDLVERTRERYYEAELHRIKGELLWMKGKGGEAQAAYGEAIQLARQQKAKSLELRATTSQCRLWQAQGKRGEAQEMLAGTYAWFTEGFETPDLKEAKALLETLS